MEAMCEINCCNALYPINPLIFSVKAFTVYICIYTIVHAMSYFDNVIKSAYQCYSVLEHVH